MTGNEVRPVALITGASRGIGLAAAEALAKEGFAIAINSREADGALTIAHAQISRHGTPVLMVPFDVSDLSAHEPALEQIETVLGPLTTLVNNAGVGVLRRGDLLEVTEESWDRCFNVNAKASFFLSQAFARRVLRQSTGSFRSIVNVTSSNAVAVSVARAEYCASKAAAAMVSKSLAARLAADGIAVYDVQPGLIATDMTAAVIETYRARAEQGLTLFPRVGQPEEIGTIVATLASGRMPYTTGHVISADGGMLVPRF